MTKTKASGPKPVKVELMPPSTVTQRVRHTFTRLETWLIAGMAVAMFGVLIVAANTYQTTLENRLSLSDLQGRVEAKTADRYSASDADREFGLLRQEMSDERKVLIASIKSRDAKLAKILAELDEIKWHLKHPKKQ
jgi:cell division protein FtsL